MKIDEMVDVFLKLVEHKKNFCTLAPPNIYTKYNFEPKNIGPGVKS